MTADRPGVRWGARWLARMKAVSGIINMIMLVMTGTSTALIVLNQYGYGEYAWPFLGSVATAGLLFTYLYAEAGVYNQQERDHQDIGRNFADPRLRIDDEIVGNAVFAAVHARRPTDQEKRIISEAVDDVWHKHRHGIPLDEYHH